MALPAETHVVMDVRDVEDSRDQQIMERLRMAAASPVGSRTSSGPVGTFRFSGVEGTGGTTNKRIRITHTASDVI
jgi:hypothetical protein